MHRMVAAERQSGNDGFRRIPRHERARRKGISHDSIIDLRINRSLIHADARAAGSSLDGFTETLNYVRLSSSRLVLQGYQKSAFMWLIEVVVVPRPSVDVNDSARPHHHVASVTNAGSKYGRAKAGGQRQFDVIVGGGCALRLFARTGLVLSRDSRDH